MCGLVASSTAPMSQATSQTASRKRPRDGADAESSDDEEIVVTASSSASVMYAPDSQPASVADPLPESGAYSPAYSPCRISHYAHWQILFT